MTQGTLPLQLSSPRLFVQSRSSYSNVEVVGKRRTYSHQLRKSPRAALLVLPQYMSAVLPRGQPASYFFLQCSVGCAGWHSSSPAP